MELKLRLRGLWEELRTTLWFRPGLTTLMAVAVAVAVTSFDRNGTYPSGYDLSPDNARAILSTIAGSMLSVVTMTFSIIMVVLVLASQQFSPRILRNFVRDQTSQNILSTFIGTFIYCLLVMIRVSDYGEDIFVPVWAVLIAILLALISMAALIYFIDHIAKQTRVSYILAEINRQTEMLLHQLPLIEQPQHTNGKEAEPLPNAPNDAIRIFAEESGYVQAVDFGELVRLAAADKVTIQVDRAVGDFVSTHGDFLTVWPVDHLSAEVDVKLRATFDIGPERTMMADVLLGFQQLMEIALKAVSPGINDPTTAINCLNYMTNLLILAAERAELPVCYHDEEHKPRVICRHSSFEEMVNLAFSQLRHYAGGDIVIIERMLDALGEIAHRTEEQPRLDVLWRHARLIARTAATDCIDPNERHKLNGKLRRIARQTGQSAESILLNIYAN